MSVEAEPQIRAIQQGNPSQRFYKLEAGIDSLSKAMSNMTRGQWEQTKILKAIQESLSNRDEAKLPSKSYNSSNHKTPQMQHQKLAKPRFRPTPRDAQAQERSQGRARQIEALEEEIEWDSNEGDWKLVEAVAEVNPKD